MMFQSLVAECRRVTHEPPSDDEQDVLESVYDLMCKFHDGWRAHADLEMAR
jgi:hypothetical protein